MTDFTLVDPKGWEYDLHSVRSSSTTYSWSLIVYFFTGVLRIYGLFSDIQHSMVYTLPEFLIVVAEISCWTGTNDHGVTYFNHSTSFWPFLGQSSLLQTNGPAGRI